MMLDEFPTLQARNLLPETLKKFEVVRLGRALSMPLHSANGAVAGRLFRNPPGVQPKYVVDPPTAFGYLFGFSRRKSWVLPEAVTLVEGPFDVMALDQEGIPAVGMVGTSLTQFGVFCLAHLEMPVVVCTDEDVAGFTSSMRVARQLICAGCSVVVYARGLELKREWMSVKIMACEVFAGRMALWR